VNENLIADMAEAARRHGREDVARELETGLSGQPPKSHTEDGPPAPPAVLTADNFDEKGRAKTLPADDGGDDDLAAHDSADGPPQPPSVLSPANFNERGQPRR